MGPDKVKAFLNHLATQMNVAASAQNQAFSALLFLYQEVIKERLPWIDDIVRAKETSEVACSVYSGRSTGGFIQYARHTAVNGPSALRERSARHGMRAFTDQRCRPWLHVDHAPRRQRGPSPYDDDAGQPGGCSAIRTVQELLCHKSVSTTMVYTHVLNRSGIAVKSPLD